MSNRRKVPRIDEATVYAVCTAANRLEAERRDRECRCPGRAYVPHAWDLDTHLDGCRAGYAWLSVDECRSALLKIAQGRR